MIVPIQNCVILGLGVISWIVFTVFYIKSKKYDAMFENLDEKEYPMKEIYSIGFAFLETIKYAYKSDSDRKLCTQLEIFCEKIR